MQTRRNTQQLEEFSDEQKLARRLEEDLMKLHGPMLGGKALYSALGYTTPTAFRMAITRKHMPIPVFPIPHRRGKFALVKDLATWLAHHSMSASSGKEST